MSGSVSSSGLAETTRIHGQPASDTEGKLATQSCTIASGRNSAQISVSRSCEYSAPSTNSAQIGAVTVSSCSIVGRRNCGDVSRTNSAQPPPTASAPSGGGDIRISRSSNPRLASSPSNDSSMTKTVRMPRSSRWLPMATRLFVGPHAPGSGNNATVGWLIPAESTPSARAQSRASDRKMHTICGVSACKHGRSREVASWRAAPR